MIDTHGLEVAAVRGHGGTSESRRDCVNGAGSNTLVAGAEGATRRDDPVVTNEMMVVSPTLQKMSYFRLH